MRAEFLPEHGTEGMEAQDVVGLAEIPDPGKMRVQEVVHEQAGVPDKVRQF